MTPVAMPISAAEAQRHELKHRAVAEPATRHRRERAPVSGAAPAARDEGVGHAEPGERDGQQAAAADASASQPPSGRAPLPTNAAAR